MLRVTIEIVPHGDKSRAEVLHTINVSDEETNHYNDAEYSVARFDGADVPVWGAWINRFDRSQGALVLAHEAIGIVMNPPEKLEAP